MFVESRPNNNQTQKQLVVEITEIVYGAVTLGTEKRASPENAKRTSRTSPNMKRIYRTTTNHKTNIDKHQRM